MKITKDQLNTLWYEDKEGNEIKIPGGQNTPEEALYQVSRFPNVLTTTRLKLIKQADVDKCKHPRKYIIPTYGWVNGVVGRECQLCHGTQTKKTWHFWPRKWTGRGSRKIFSSNSSWNEKTVLAMVNSGDYTLKEAIIIYATACERCANVLLHKYTNGTDGYEEYSDEWEKCGTSCCFCVED